MNGSSNRCRSKRIPVIPAWLAWLIFTPIGLPVPATAQTGSQARIEVAEPVSFAARAIPVPGKTAWQIEVRVRAGEGWYVLAPGEGSTRAPVQPALELPRKATHDGQWSWPGKDPAGKELRDGAVFRTIVEADSVESVAKIRLQVRFQSCRADQAMPVQNLAVPLEVPAWGPQLPFENGPVLDPLGQPVDNREIYQLALQRGQQMISLAGLPGLDQLNRQLRERDQPAEVAWPAVGLPAADQLYPSMLQSSLIFCDVYDCGRCENLHVSTAGGVIISRDGLALTNHHVMEKKNPGSLGVVAITHEGICHPVLEVLSASASDDVALVRLGGDTSRFQPAPLARRAPPPLTPVLVLSHPHREYFVLTEGKVSRYVLDRRRDASTWMEITAEYGAGSSGSAIFNEQGEVVGLVSMVAPLIRHASSDDRRPRPDRDEEDPERKDADLLELLLKKCVPLSAIRERFADPQ